MHPLIFPTKFILYAVFITNNSPLYTKINVLFDLSFERWSNINSVNKVNFYIHIPFSEPTTYYSNDNL